MPSIRKQHRRHIIIEAARRSASTVWLMAAVMVVLLDSMTALIGLNCP
ncbi:hypothetical protein PAJL_1553 [Cutibacterium acnes HL042PA3]|nr:hypothetical protein TIIST44_01605 [Cutibacterium acnes subsp. defendens ATCC 11828]ESK58722.1 hypothetical protein PAJL_1553 [Cutibacterium acnes HL042PA3]KFC13554.1 hypothetical protein PAST2_10733 [Cutibacterium acnes HL202PA1]MCW5114650.1 hypothetical protein [Cutibacterium acnes P05]